MNITDITDKSNEFYALTEKDMYVYKYSSEQLGRYTNSKIEKIFTDKVDPYPHDKTDSTNRAKRISEILEHQEYYSVIIRDENIVGGWDRITSEAFYYIKDVLKDMDNLYLISYKQSETFAGPITGSDYKLFSYTLKTIPKELNIVHTFNKHQQEDFVRYWKHLAESVKFGGNGYYNNHIDDLKELGRIAKEISKKVYTQNKKGVVVTENSGIFEFAEYRTAHDRSGVYLPYEHIVKNIVNKIKENFVD